ncbi:hypothetical protein ACHHYP_02054 [Achlya hypogyna]|uniref:Secreted protein n=1 Tax=Achlya hypogyna TaxID=1202772 RepID=A0A1V9ZSH2_ACHHY|nr:hypothetical protein ACHHYP_02054 [Achlya hypogyna]
MTKTPWILVLCMALTATGSGGLAPEAWPSACEKCARTGSCQRAHRDLPGHYCGAVRAEHFTSSYCCCGLDQACANPSGDAPCACTALAVVQEAPPDAVTTARDMLLFLAAWAVFMALLLHDMPEGRAFLASLQRWRCRISCCRRRPLETGPSERDALLAMVLEIKEAKSDGLKVAAKMEPSAHR